MLSKVSKGKQSQREWRTQWGALQNESQEPFFRAQNLIAPPPPPPHTHTHTKRYLIRICICRVNINLNQRIEFQI